MCERVVEEKRREEERRRRGRRQGGERSEAEGRGEPACEDMHEIWARRTKRHRRVLGAVGAGCRARDPWTESRSLIGRKVVWGQSPPGIV